VLAVDGLRITLPQGTEAPWLALLLRELR